MTTQRWVGRASERLGPSAGAAYLEDEGTTARGSLGRSETGSRAPHPTLNCNWLKEGGLIKGLAQALGTLAGQNPSTPCLFPQPESAHLPAWRPCPGSPSQSCSGSCHHHRPHTCHLSSWTPPPCHSRRAEGRDGIIGRRLPCHPTPLPGQQPRAPSLVPRPQI